MSHLSPVEELALLLRPAGGGVHVVSTGREEQLAVQQRLYGVSSESDIRACFRERLDRIRKARVILLGIPSDVGAGFRRGANLAPQALRRVLLERHADLLEEAGDALLDIGDVFVVPQLLQDEMLCEEQLRACRAALYPGNEDRGFPVSPLSIAERALDLVLQLNPAARPVILGGDHSCAWPAVAALARVRPEGLGIVQPDAHTDLLEHRLGIRICFATWSYHANELLGRGGRLVQVGIRASRFPREHWESTLGVRQFWAEDCAQPDALEAIVEHLHRAGVKSIYFSNDIDGTSAEYARATGTPEPGGLSPEFVVELIRRLAQEFELTGGDLVEVAPPLGPTPEDTERTLELGGLYLRETLKGALRTSR